MVFPITPDASSYFERLTWRGVAALAATSLLFPIFVSARYGRAPGRIVSLLWPWVTLGAFLIGAPMYRVIRGADHAATAALAVFGLYLLLLIHFAMLAIPRMRGTLVRGFIVLPGTVLSTASLIAAPFAALAAIARAVGLGAAGPAGAMAVTACELTPVALAVLGVAGSIWPRRETVRIVATADRPKTPRRVPCERRLDGSLRKPTTTTLRVAQLTDLHLGGLVTVPAVQRLVRRILKREPDLIFLTGDFLALEGMFSKGSLAEALAPLREAEGRTFAIRGNHDLDAPDEVASALADAGVRLLIDQSVLVTTAVGVVEVIGVDHRDRGRRRHVRRVLAGARPEGARVRLVMLHDPGRFADLEPPYPDLVFSGHLHGGQVGLISLGLPYTMLTPTRLPDHGLFGLGACRLYAHRGTGTFGFPLRLGVPGEESVIDYELEGAVPSAVRAPGEPGA